MTISGKPIDGIKWYVKFTPRNIRCVYIDIDDIPRWLKPLKSAANDIEYNVKDVNSTFTFEDVLENSPLSTFSGGGITYCQHGLCENGYETISPTHKFVGWDYGHDIDVILGHKPSPLVQDIENHVKATVDYLKKYKLKKSKK